MLQLFWLIVKIGILVGGAIWISARPGTVDIKWMEHDVSVSFGMFLLAGFVILTLTIGLTRFMLYFAKLPERYKQKKIIGNAEKGLDALTLSLSSAAAGDYGHAQFQASRALKLLPGHQPLPLLLQASAQRKQGDFDQAEESLKSMLSHPEGAMLAARSLIGNASQQNNITAALTYARTAEKDYTGKDKGWLLETLYQLEAKAGNWDAAEAALNKAIKKKAVSKETAASDYVAIGTMRALALKNRNEDAAAVKILKAVLRKNAGFAPAIECLYELYTSQGRVRAAANVIKKGWIAAPHPALLKLWRASSKKDVHDLNHLKKLTKLNAKHVESYLALAESYMQNADYDAAKIELEKAAALSPQRRMYKLWAQLTEKSGGSEASIRQRLEQMTDANADPSWICRESAIIYDEWSALAPPHNAFNTIIWESRDNLKREQNHDPSMQSYEYLLSA